MTPPSNPLHAAALGIVRRLHQRGHPAYFAGGCVRDLLLGREPLDFDVATAATPDEVQAAFPRTEAVGAHFGVVLVLQPQGATEVATFRHDGAYTDGRRPDAVRFSLDPREDVLRRDFTLNGLLLDALAYDAGAPLPDCVLDYVGGRADLAAGVLRAIGDPVLRFTEDKLRMLRAVRFAARLGFTIEPGTLAAIQALAPHIHAVSVERIRDELTRILTEGAAARGLQLLHATGLLVELLPEVARLQGVEQPPEYHPEGDVWVHTLMLLDHLPSGPVPSGPLPSGHLTPGHLTPGAPATLAWGMLLHDIGKPATFTPPDPAGRPDGRPDRIRFSGHVEVGLAIARDLLARLRFSKDDTAQILALIQHHMQFGDIKKMKQSTLKRFLRLPAFDEHLALHRADCLSSHGSLEMYDFARQQIEQLTQQGHDDQLRPTPLLTGAGLIAAGYRPGPPFSAMLLAVEDAQLEGRLATREDALRFIAETFGPPPQTAAPPSHPVGTPAPAHPIGR